VNLVWKNLKGEDLIPTTFASNFHCAFGAKDFYQNLLHFFFAPSAQYIFTRIPVLPEFFQNA